MKSFSSTVYLFILFLISWNTASAQDEDLLKLLGEEKPKREITKNAFKSTRVINSQSMEFLSPGTMDFIILHRFGQISEGMGNFFGLDQASMRMALDFGIMQNLMVGIGRSTYKKELDAFIKYAPIRQSTGLNNFPATIAISAGTTLNTLPWSDPLRQNYFTSRLAYYTQVIIGRKFNENFSLQLSPTMVHNNLVSLQTIPNDVFATSLGGRVKVSKRMALTFDYTYIIQGVDKNTFKDPLSIGLDIETGGHVFQLHFSNSTGMNERAFITETTGSWDKAEIRFGFNLSRMFQIKKQKEVAKE
jgi:hypothetical protein